MYAKSTIRSNIAMLSQKPYTRAGFEPGSPVSVTDAMSTAPRRMVIYLRMLLSLTITPFATY
jgi:hypothetical protein